MKATGMAIRMRTKNHSIDHAHCSAIVPEKFYTAAGSAEMKYQYSLISLWHLYNSFKFTC